MLEQRDIELLTNIIKETIKTEVKDIIKSEIDSIKSDVANMKSDVQSLKSTDNAILDELVRTQESSNMRFDKLEQDVQDLKSMDSSILDKLDQNTQKLKSMDSSILDKLDQNTQELKSMDSSILDELVRTQESSNRQFDNLERELQELKSYYQVSKLENDNSVLIVNCINNINKRLDRLEKKETA